MKLSYKGMNLEGTPQEVLLFISLYDGPREGRNYTTGDSHFHEDSSASAPPSIEHHGHYLPQPVKLNVRDVLKQYEMYSSILQQRSRYE
ncbi:hypothetical protein SD70_15850 [Gordoniibacillus kamchatkensis]|uniref:Uncharacterized protein n=1 Tax=Gordoniibacillus kamchatkensis TaxID=1590651 RepID=A0ABR5AGG0_9BACL|nr:hypothetical protein [Paenibacillus sp. VKM B-2647]KIL40141.1 hypothetical protein SD70_15850 [Paenibacillus sp. VKM B-2647]